MINEQELLECMEDMKQIASARGNRLTTAEIDSYLAGMDFDEAQKNAIYRYLTTNHIRVEGYRGPADTPATDVPASPRKSRPAAASNQAPARRQSRSSRNLSLYRREVASLPALEDEELLTLWQEYLRGNDSVREELIHVQLPAVIEMAGKYKKHGIPAEELIAEGNIGILTAMQIIREDAASHHAASIEDIPNLHGIIEAEVRLAIEGFIDDETMAKDRENTILAKANLLHEASKYLAEENGRVATKEELAEFTKLSLLEVKNILNLSEDAKGISD